MNSLLFFRYTLFLLLLLPTILYAFLPLLWQMRFPSKKTALLLNCGSAAIILILALFGATNNITAKWLFLLGLIPLFFLYYMLTKGNIVKKLFSFLNATMITSNTIVFAFLLAAPWELDNHFKAPLMHTSLLCLAISVLLGLIYRKTLTVKIPYLLRTGALAWNWRFAVIVPAVIMLPAVIAGKFTVMMVLAYLLLTSGLGYFIMFQLAVYNKQTLPLDSKLVGKNGVESGLQLVIELVGMFVPLLLVGGMLMLTEENTAYMVMAILGLLLTIAHPLWLRNIYERMMTRKYENLEGFHASR